MRVVGILTIVPLLAGVAAAQTQPGQPSSQSQNQNQNRATSPGQAQAQSLQLQQKVRQNLAQAGFTDIHVMPSSFLVRAKDKDGNPVMMIINPDSIAAVTTIPTQGNSTTGQGSSNAQPRAGANPSGTNPSSSPGSNAK